MKRRIMKNIKKIVLGMLVMLCLACEDIISVPDISEDQIFLLAPAEGAILEDSMITFSWEELGDVDQYQLQVATPGFEMANQIVLDTILGDSIQSFRNFTTTLENNVYEWRVRAFNSNFATDYTTSDFIVNDPQGVDLSDQQLVLLTPEDNLETTETAITLSWEILEQATAYRIVITDLADSSVFLEESLDMTERIVTFMPGSYTWAVRAENDSQNTAFTTRNLTILE